jgi:protein-tyrosine phosphatase
VIDRPVRILVVCTANICRSPAAATFLRREFADSGHASDFEVASAGVAALEGSAACDLSDAFVGERTGEPPHVSQRVTPKLLADADLILAAAREHRSAIAGIDPKARPRTHTVRQAGRAASWLVQDEPDGGGVLRAARNRAAGEAAPYETWDFRASVSPLPDGGHARFEWMIGELDAARGLVPVPNAADPVGRGRAQREYEALLGHPDDVADPHVVGYNRHEQSISELRKAVAAFTAGLMAVLSY